mgnify:FL=1
MVPFGEGIAMRRAGFTLIEILIVVGIIVIMLASAVVSVASGRGAVQAKEATRGVVQLSRYASALALLRQRPVVVTFHHDGRIDVRISGEATGQGDVGSPSDPIYREVDGESTMTSAEYSADDEDEAPVATGRKVRRSAATGGKAASGGSSPSSDAYDERNGFFYTRRVLDPEVLAKEDADGKYDGVTFSVEVLGEDGAPLEPAVAASRSLRQPKRNVRNADADAADGESAEEDQEPPVSVTYETNGNVNPHRVTVRLAGEAADSEGFVINISRSGKATVGDAEEVPERRGRAKRRRR